MAYASSLWLWTARAVERPRARLFCFPYAGSGAGVFRTWPKRLPPDVEVLAAQYPGRGTRHTEPLVRRIEPLLDGLELALSPNLDVPYVFFGHSMGGLLAFELCRRFARRGAPLPARLFLSARPAPGRERRSAPPGGRSDANLLEKLRRYGGTPPEILNDPEMLALVLPIFRADLEALDAFRVGPGEPLTIPLTVLGGDRDDAPALADLEGWRAYTLGGCAIHAIHGGHFFLHSAEAEVLRLVSAALEVAALR